MMRGAHNVKLTCAMEYCLQNWIIILKINLFLHWCLPQDTETRQRTSYHDVVQPLSLCSTCCKILSALVIFLQSYCIAVFNVSWKLSALRESWLCYNRKKLSIPLSSDYEIMTGITSPSLLRLTVPNSELLVDLPNGLPYFTLHRKMQKSSYPVWYKKKKKSFWYEDFVDFSEEIS